MHLLADENLHADLVAWFRSTGHDVLYAAEELSGNTDEDLLETAWNEQRILVAGD